MTRNGEPVTDLEPYLAAYGHLVALREGDLAYLRVHPEGAPGDGETEPGPEVVFYAEAVRTGRRIGSAALVADGLHARTDGFTSLAVVLSAAGAWLGFPLADPIIGLLITVAILFVLRDAAREVYRRLMDAVDPDLVDQTEQVIRSTPGVVDVTDIGLRWLGHSLRAEARVVVDSSLSLVEAHHLSHRVEHDLLRGVRRLSSSPSTPSHSPPTPPTPATWWLIITESRSVSTGSGVPVQI